MNFRNVLLRSAALTVFCLGTAYAATPEEIGQRSDEIFAREAIEFRQLEREIMLLPTEQQGLDLDLLAPTSGPRDSSAAAGVCREIKTIELLGVSVLDKRTQSELVAPFERDCLNIEDIQSLQNKIIATYVLRGYVAARAYLPEQDLSTGHLKVLVAEGLIGKFISKGKLAEVLNYRRLVPSKEGDILSIRDLEQAVEQAGAMGRGKVRLSLEPAEKAGVSNVVFSGESDKRFSGSISYDDQGSVSTGETNLSLSASTANILRQNERWDVVHKESSPGGPDASNESTSVNVKVPSGYSSYGIRVATSAFSTSTVTQLGRKLFFTGNKDDIELSYERVLNRGKSDLHKAVLSVSTSENESFLDGEKIEVSSRRFVKMRAGLDSRITWAGGTLKLKPTLVMGLAKLDNLPADFNLPADSPQSEFSVLELSGSFGKKLKVLRKEFDWLARFKGQITEDRLYSMDQLTIGNSSSVRGFKDYSAGGESGLYLQNELGFPFSLNTAKGPVNFRPYLALDAGYVENAYEALASSALVGFAAGLSVQFKQLSLTLDTAKSLEREENMEEEGALSNFRVTVNF